MLWRQQEGRNLLEEREYEGSDLEQLQLVSHIHIRKLDMDTVGIPRAVQSTVLQGWVTYKRGFCWPAKSQAT